MSVDISEYYPAWVPFKVERPAERFYCCPECRRPAKREAYGGESYTTYTKDEGFGIDAQNITFHDCICENGHTWSVL